jgi:hypothetical protein
MRRILTALFGLALVGVVTAGLWLAPPNAATPQDGWALLTQIEISDAMDDDGVWRATKTYPPQLEALDGDRFALVGYAIPIDIEDTIQSFILVSDPQDCPFCGSNGYGPVLEVNLAQPAPIMEEFAQIAVEGTLVLNRDHETYQAVRLDAAMLTDLPDA